MKGLFFACALCGFALTAALTHNKHDSRRRIGIFCTGGIAVFALWLLVSWSLGYLDDLLAVYSTFLGLALGSQQRVWPWAALAEPLRWDSAWWVGPILALLAQLGGRKRGTRLPRGVLWGIAFALVPLTFLFLHPHSWAYVLLLPAPFLSLIMADSLDRISHLHLLAIGTGLLMFLAIHSTIAGVSPWSKYFTSLASPRSPQVASLRLLKGVAWPGDRIVDPSGLAYFIEPCVKDWYLDKIFQEYAARGLWMQAMENIDLNQCPWVLNTYRLRMLPKTVEARMSGQYVLTTGALALHQADPRLAGSRSWPRLAHDELHSFW